ncbi:MAG TPA: hypothetical protein VGB17_15620 [Pyrinomonadaceae bacterium]|jgi:hypothetical protein
MEVPTIGVDRNEARKRVEEFTARRRRNLTELDRALFKGYKALSEGLSLIDVNQAIKMGGQFDDNYCPKIAIARADLKTIYFDHRLTYEESPQGQLGGLFTAWIRSDWERDPIAKALRETEEARTIGMHEASRNRGLQIELPAGTLEKPDEKAIGGKRWFKATYASTVPEVPFHLRPNGDISNYFILWEVAEWRGLYLSPRAPADPLLLERIAHPIYVVVAQWDLTELEQKLLEAFRR